MPSVLGLGRLTPLISASARACSSLEVERAQTLARVFWPTRAYERARRALARHAFVVLTGPPEMGKTAIAQMLALAQMTDGWEAHECSSPEQLWRVFEVALRPRRLMVFDNLALAHGRRGCRRPGELHQRVFGRRQLSPVKQRALRERVLDAFHSPAAHDAPARSSISIP
jgi:hypothetical protein